MKSRQHSSDNRLGFTLVELLVTIGIMSLLVTLLVVAAGPALTNARIKATQATITQVNAMIQQRQTVIAAMDLSKDAETLAYYNGASGMTPKEAEFLIRSVIYRQAFPQRPEDLYGVNMTYDGGDVDDAPYAAKWVGTGTPARVPTSSDGNAWTSSSLLLLALSEGGSVRPYPGKVYRIPTFNIDDINSAHLSEHDFAADVLPPPSPGTPPINQFETALVDSWGEPIRFYNWPTCLFRPGGAGSTLIPANPVNLTNASILVSGVNSSTAGTDSLDPVASVNVARSSTTQFWGTSTFNLYYNASGAYVTAAPFNEAYYRTQFTFYTPLLVSGGADLEFGMYEPTDSLPVQRLGGVEDVEAIYDNITNRQD